MFSNEVQTTTSTTSKGPASVTVYKDGQLVTQTQIVLKKSEDIEAYVINMVRNYFRTTYKNGTELGI